MSAQIKIPEETKGPMDPDAFRQSMEVFERRMSSVLEKHFNVIAQVFPKPEAIGRGLVDSIFNKQVKTLIERGLLSPDAQGEDYLIILEMSYLGSSALLMKAQKLKAKYFRVENTEFELSAKDKMDTLFKTYRER